MTTEDFKDKLEKIVVQLGTYPNKEDCGWVISDLDELISLYEEEGIED